MRKQSAEGRAGGVFPVARPGPLDDLRPRRSQAPAAAKNRSGGVHPAPGSGHGIRASARTTRARRRPSCWAKKIPPGPGPEHEETPPPPSSKETPRFEETPRLNTCTEPPDRVALRNGRTSPNEGSPLPTLLPHFPPHPNRPKKHKCGTEIIFRRTSHLWQFQPPERKTHSNSFPSIEGPKSPPRRRPGR